MLTALNVWMQASSALTPTQGSAAACAAFPAYSKSVRTIPRRSWWRMVRSKPWIIIAQSTPSNTPARMSFTLPPPPSSAGVPITWTRPAGSRARTAARAAPAPAPDVAMMLCPHACPMPGSASYSHMIATVGPSPAPFTVARNAVGTPPTPRSTSNPLASRNPQSQPEACTSW